MGCCGKVDEIAHFIHVKFTYSAEEYEKLYIDGN